jgi:hypothetical protein
VSQPGLLEVAGSRIDRVLPNQFPNRCLFRFGPVPCSGRSGPGSTRRAVLGFKTMQLTARHFADTTRVVTRFPYKFLSWCPQFTLSTTTKRAITARPNFPKAKLSLNLSAGIYGWTPAACHLNHHAPRPLTTAVLSTITRSDLLLPSTTALHHRHRKHQTRFPSLSTWQTPFSSRFSSP